ncbi:MAG: major capsid protein, partial [Solirubrobacteraceae bacterium]
SGAAVASPEAATVATGGARVLLASGGHIVGGDPVDRATLAQATADALGRMARTGPPRGVALIASAQFDYPESRRLGLDAELNSAILERETGLAAIVASGGICGPTNVDYDVPTWATTKRPLKEGLPAFQATRGGLRFIEPPDVGPLAAATAVWTEATDANPGASTKPVFSVSCGSEQLVYVNAISTRLGFGNMQGRFQPELVAANTDLAMAAAARIAEIKLLELITEKCVKDVTSAKVLGATRDLITAMNQAASFFRYQHRLDPKIMLTGIFPDWIKGVIKADLAREGAHQQGADWNSLAISDAQVEVLIKGAGINPIFTLDSLPVNGSVYPTQQLAAQSASGAINAFPTKMVWNMFPEGAMQFLDGGRLDLGVVRDSTLDATNDYETFVETFEGIAARGFANSAVQFVTELCANGKSGATETVSTCA